MDLRRVAERVVDRFHIHDLEWRESLVDLYEDWFRTLFLSPKVR